MWRALLYLALLALASYAAVWLANHPETVAVTWGGREYTTSLAVGVVAVVGLAVAISVLSTVVRWFLRLPSTIGRNSRMRRRERGLSALSRGIIAVGSGDVTAARRYAAQAERLIGAEPLTLLLKAQAAQASGNREAAEAAFRRMTELPDTRVLGLRGLFVEARRRGDTDTARAYAEEAARIAPAVPWANEAVLEGFSRDRDWSGAIALVERRASLGLVDKAESRRQRAVLFTADAQDREESDPDGALKAAQEAFRLAPDLAPAAALAGRLLARRGDLRRAAKVIETAWAATHHPDLAGAYLNVRPGDSASDRMRRAETLARLSSWAPEARLAIARAATEAREFGRAREALRPLLEDRPTMRVCLAMADLEAAEGTPGRGRDWLGRATRAPRDKAWIADGIVSETWAPLSPVTGRLDAFVWDTPPQMLGAPDAEDSLPHEDEPAVSLAAPEGALGDAPPARPADADVVEATTSAETARTPAAVPAEHRPVEPAPTPPRSSAARAFPERSARDQSPAETAPAETKPTASEPAPQALLRTNGAAAGQGATASRAATERASADRPAQEPIQAETRPAVVKAAEPEPARDRPAASKEPSPEARPSPLRAVSTERAPTGRPEPDPLQAEVRPAAQQDGPEPEPTHLLRPVHRTRPAWDIEDEAAPASTSRSDVSQAPAQEAASNGSGQTAPGREPEPAPNHLLRPVQRTRPAWDIEGDPAPAPTSSSDRPHPVKAGAPNGSGQPTAHREPEPVVFPVAHAPDDPGPEDSAEKRGRFRLMS
jgi:HemY protein